MANEVNGWGTFALTTGGMTMDVIDFVPPEIISDDDVDTSSNSNGDADGGVKSKEPAQMFSVGDTSLTVKYSAENHALALTLQGVKDTGTLTTKSGAVIAGQGWIKGYTPDTFSPADAPTATVLWANYTGDKGQTLPTITPSV